jgi:alkaline phosphatase
MNSRRRFLQGLAAAAPMAVTGCATVKGSRPRPVAVPGQVPRNIVHLVVDGMSSGMLSCGNHYSNLTRHRDLTWMQLLNRPELVHGMMDVRSQNSVVTDSSASSSAWGSGVRIPNGMVNQTSTGRRLVTLYELLGTAGWQRGLVTTTEITHATPAGFASCNKSRNNAEEIALDYFDRRVEVLMGGGRKYFESGSRKDKRDLKAEFRSAGYALMEKPSELKSAPGDRPLLGLFTAGHLPYEVDVAGNLTKVEEAPSLATMTRAALKRLKGGERFILQVEGGRVDHACHGNDAAAAVREMIGFDEAIDVCLEFQAEHPDTLLVMTTDHATGNPGLNGMGDNYGKSGALFRNLLMVRQSIGELIKRLLLAETPEEYARLFNESTGYTPSTRRRELLDPFLKKKGYALYDVMAADVAAIGQVLANHVGISFTGTGHTSDHVPILALGPGAEMFRGFIENTAVFGHYLAFAGVQFRNPQERLIAAGPTDPTSFERVNEYGWV